MDTVKQRQHRHEAAGEWKYQKQAVTCDAYRAQLTNCCWKALLVFHIDMEHQTCCPNKTIS